MITLKAPLRTPDNFGQGHFGASRGSHKHNGIDYACSVGSFILAPISGKVTKIGYPYGNDLSFRYVQITTQDEEPDLHVRVFYIQPIVSVGDYVLQGEDEIGISQKLGKRYEGITEHVHLEIKDHNGYYLNPEGIL